MKPTVDQLLKRVKKWKPEITELRRILLETPLEEAVKWYQPCYTYLNKNVVIIGSFKEYCSLGFFKGVLFNDPSNILVQAGENTQSVRIMKFTSVDDIQNQESAIKDFVKQGIEAEKAGKKVKFKPTEAYEIPDELQIMMEEIPELATAFNQLTPGRQRGYLLHFSAPKQSKTRTARIEKCIPKIMAGEGFSQGYKKNNR